MQSKEKAEKLHVSLIIRSNHIRNQIRITGKVKITINSIIKNEKQHSFE